MKIIIDTDVTDNLGLTTLEFLYLHILANGLPTELSFDTLIELGYLNEDFELTNQGIDVIRPKVSDAMMLFVKTYDAYPHKVGTRVLKAKSIDSADGKHCLSKFNHYIRKDPNVAERMHKGLIVELKLRKKGNSENFFQDIRTWFNQMTWDKYADLDVEVDTDERVERI
jgi:hypothetical protein